LAPDPATWFLPFTSSDPTADNGDGRPWGDGTAMAARATAPDGPLNPWDENCSVDTFAGSYSAMAAIRGSLEDAITAANAAGNIPGKCGRVYLTDWRFNCMRDLSENNPWVLGPWPGDPTGTRAAPDQTAIGLVLRLMQAGVIVRIMIWCPLAVSAPKPANYAAQIADHFYAARLVGAENTRLMAKQAPASGEQIGVVALDIRTADSTLWGTHHQKTMVIRSADTSTPSVAYVGGVDLAYTRRDAKPLEGDWQSGNAIPDPSAGWPHDATTNYASTTAVKLFSDRQAVDLPVNVYGDGKSLLTYQIWHDQHIRLKGPIVATLESQFAERWVDTTRGRAFDVSSAPNLLQNWRGAQVMFSTSAAIDATGGVVPLALTAPEPAAAGGATRVQMWRTIPWRKTRTGPPFQRAEFTVMAGIANAVKQARELIWMFDQYFWSQPLARLLNAQLLAHPGLRLIVILPPHADVMTSAAHYARALALNALTAGLSTTGNSFDQVAVYDLWLDPSAPPDSSRNRGIYVHAKTHTYDDGLLVCGSANLNRRSFTCDSEIACAVLDPAVVLSHQKKLWAALFNGAARPDIDLSVSGNGKAFFDQFRAAVAAGSATLIPDPWQAANPTLPNNAPRDQSMTAYYAFYSGLLDPSSVSTKVEDQVRDGPTGALRAARLDEIVSRLENVHVGSRWPWRHP
jgi:phosphatidylserine/phosphatidylglycerophosphate/cardiolipin synthase-like enzyme